MNNSYKPYFSIIIASYNHGNYVSDAIQSVINQKFDDWELIIVDDFSTDNSWEIIKSFSDPRILKYKLDRNHGGAYTYNYALLRCRGQFIATLDSDDKFHEDKLIEQKNIFEKRPEVKICGTWVHQISEDGSLVDSENWFNLPINLNLPESWIWQNRLCHSSVVFCSSISKEIGFANCDLQYTPDWEIWIRALVLKMNFFVIQKKLTYSRQHSNNITHLDGSRLRMEWAKISADYFHPFLWSENRFDLILLNLKEFSKESSHVDKSNFDEYAFIEALGFSVQDLSLRGSDTSTACAIQSALIKKAVEYDSARLKLAKEKFERDVAMSERDVAISERDAAMSERDVVPGVVRSIFIQMNRFLHLCASIFKV